jgi:membrane protein implicated in regulation of membrane protease activity
VVLVLALLLVLFVLPMPWAVVVLALGVVGEVGEIVWGRRLARRWRPRTGAESMIGREAEVVSACRPTGQVRIGGELWGARAEAGADPGEIVRVDAVDGLTLAVSPLETR